MDKLKEKHEDLKTEVVDSKKSYEGAIKDLHDAKDWLIKMQRNYYKAELELLDFAIINKITNE